MLLLPEATLEGGKVPVATPDLFCHAWPARVIFEDHQLFSPLQVLLILSVECEETVWALYCRGRSEVTHTERGCFSSHLLHLLPLAMQSSPDKNLRRAEDAHSFAFSLPWVFCHTQQESHNDSQ